MFKIGQDKNIDNKKVSNKLIIYSLMFFSDKSYNF
jgi:hypothetical protein